VDRFLAERHAPVHTHAPPTATMPVASPSAPSSASALPQPPAPSGGQWGQSRQAGLPEPPALPQQATPPPTPASSGNGAVKPAVYDFVCEDDVRRALTAREKIYVNARTIITPAARDLGDAHEIFARG